MVVRPRPQAANCHSEYMPVCWVHERTRQLYSVAICAHMTASKLYSGTITPLGKSVAAACGTDAAAGTSFPSPCWCACPQINGGADGFGPFLVNVTLGQVSSPLACMLTMTSCQHDSSPAAFVGICDVASKQPSCHSCRTAQAVSVTE